jgi:hypothetical protein
VRGLTDAEKRADLLAINKALNDAKSELEVQITSAQRSAISRWLAGGPLTIRLTRRMVRLLMRLYRDGQTHALAEAAAMGVVLENPGAPTAAAAVLVLSGPAAPPLLRTPAGLVPQEPLRLLMVELEVLSRKVSSDAVDLALGVKEPRGTFARELRRVAGARRAAANSVAPAFHDGLASVYLANHERFDGWQYSAVLDSNACGPCVDQDGREFLTLADALAVLPTFGGYPFCHGGKRCRCRLHPIRPIRVATP